MALPSSLARLPFLFFATAMTALLQLAGSVTVAQALDHRELDSVCPLLQHERERVLEDHQLSLKLVESELQSRRRVFEMVEKLWAVRSIEREVYLDYKRLRDRTEVRVHRMNVLIDQQQSIVQQFRLACTGREGEERAGDLQELPGDLQELPGDLQERIRALQKRYRELDCELLERDLEIASIDHEYDREILNATRNLVRSNIKTKFELVIDEFDLEQSKAQVEGYRQRAGVCRKRLSD